jgi:hypothetical protein
MLLETDNKPIAIKDILKLYESYKGNDEGLDHLDPMYHDAYKSLQINHENFAMQYKILLFESLEELTHKSVYDKRTIISILKNAKEQMSSKIVLSADPHKTADHVVESVDQFINGEEIDITVPFVLYMEKLHGLMTDFDQK